MTRGRDQMASGPSSLTSTNSELRAAMARLLLHPALFALVSLFLIVPDTNEPMVRPEA